MAQLTLVSTQLDSAISADRIEDFERLGCSLRSLLSRGPERPAWWLDILCPAKDDFEAILRPFSLHPWTLKDALAGEREDKIEVFKTYYYTRIETLVATGGNEVHQTSAKLHLVVFANGLVSFSTTQHFRDGNLQAKILQGRYELMSSTQIWYAIIKSVLGSTNSCLHDLKIETSALEDMVSTCTVDPRELWMRINLCRSKATEMSNGLRSKEGLVRSLVRHARDPGSGSLLGEAGLWLRDVQGTILLMQSELRHVNQRLSLCHSHHLAQFSLQRFQVKIQTWKVLRTLTALVAVFMALNGLVAAFGMNITIPGGSVDSYGWWIGILSGVIILLLLSMAILHAMKLM